MQIEYNEEKIILTPTLLLEYSLLGQIMFSDLDRIDQFNRKIATIIVNTFAITNNLFVELSIDNKPPEWDVSGVILAQHKMVVRFHKVRDPHFLQLNFLGHVTNLV